MSTAWEDQFSRWRGPASDTEEQKRERTEAAIREAIANSSKLRDRDLRVFAKGSYKNNTNVRLNSDVDVAVEIKEFFRYEAVHQAEGMSGDDLGFTPYMGSYSPEQLKDELVEALSSQFGSAAITRRNKAIQVRESTRSLAADVVPCVEFRRYVSLNLYGGQFHAGIKIYPDSGGSIENWPEQTYTNGVAKNTATSRNYKQVVRILKRLENDMVDKGVIPEIPSFLIESLIYNVPNSKFENSSYWEDVRQVLIHIFHGTKVDGDFNEWLEVNELKWLFRSDQKWSRSEANNFALKAWQYVGFE